MQALRTTCPYCGVGCGLRVERGDGVPLRIVGDAEHPANRGRLCSKGSALAATLGTEGRLLAPRVDGIETGWDHALDHVARGFARIIEHHGPDAVAFYVSGQLLTEDYYVANKLMKGFIGSANIDTNSRLCMSSAVAAHQRAFGEDIVPVEYEDLERAELIVLVGSNTAWCHPVLYQRIAAARERNPELRIVLIDPRRTASSALADLHLPLRSGTDGWLFNGLLAYLHRHGLVDELFVRVHTNGFDEALRLAQQSAGSIEVVARACGLECAAVEEFFALFARTQRVVTAFSQGINQSSSGTDKANAIINCHLATGRIGRTGTGPFSITGQPNAMGGREVGGLANQLAAHLRLEQPEHCALVQEFWGSPRIAERPGLKAVELFDAIEAGRVKAVWIMATNPLVSLPDAERARAALARCELVVVSDCVADTDTTRCAHVLLPAAAWGEKDGTVTNSERRISRQRAFLAAPGLARPDWWIVCELARHMGFGAGFDYRNAHQIFVEHARLSARGNAGARTFDLGGLASLDAAGYESLEPVQWPLPATPGRARPFADGRFHHPDGRARLVAIEPRLPVHEPDADYPLVLNTGRIRDQWHTMTRSGRAARLAVHEPEPFVDMHAADALAAGVRAGELVRVGTRWGALVARARTSGELARGMLFAPIHWSACSASDARVGSAVNPVVDPHSGEPEFKHTPARIEPFAVDWYAFALSRRELEPGGIAWWASATGEHCRRYELAGRGKPADRSAWARRLLDAQGSEFDWIEYEDSGSGIYRAAALREGRLEACLFSSMRAALPARGWLMDLFGRAEIGAAERAALLAGRAADAQAEPGPVVCACFGVGRATICRAIESGEISSARDIGARLRAGTNCGSCVPELERLLGAAQAAALTPDRGVSRAAAAR